MGPEPEVRCAEGHPTRSAEEGEPILPCGCVREGATIEALVAAGIPPDEPDPYA